MRRIERATRAELRKLAVSVGGSALAQAAVDLAKSLDADPADSVAVLLARELRMTVTALLEQSKGGVSDDLERLRASIAEPAFRGPGN
jgi:hypothetical protein